MSLISRSTRQQLDQVRSELTQAGSQATTVVAQRRLMQAVALLHEINDILDIAESAESSDCSDGSSVALHVRTSVQRVAAGR